jgi:hypothetical protein
MVSCQLLERFFSATTTSFSLGSVDHLPGLVMLLFISVPALREIKNDSKKNGESAQVFYDFKKSPITE